MKFAPALSLLIFGQLSTMAAVISSPGSLVQAVDAATAGTVIEMGPGTFALERPLVIKAGVTVKGAGMGKTILTHAPGWKANPGTLPDPETNFKSFDKTGYLIHLADKAAQITISHLTMTGPQLHGAIYGWANSGVELHHVSFENFMYAGFRTYQLSRSKVHDCTFINSGRRWDKGQPGVKGGITGGGIFAIWVSDTEISNNRFLNTGTAPHEHYYGIKGREGKRVRIHHNTIETNFSIEFPFENDQDVEISHNICHGTISIPKHGGGYVPSSGVTFHIHHNYFRDSYSIEFVRNGTEISHNLFDFDASKDHGNLISGFGQAAAKGPASFHDNLVSTPGRGVIWINEPHGQFTIKNNHIITRTTATPRTEGLFGFNQKSDFKAISIIDNIIECVGPSRPLFRNDESAAIVVANNKLTNISDSSRYENKSTGAVSGLKEALRFECGVDGELTVEGWKTSTSRTTRAEK